MLKHRQDRKNATVSIERMLKNNNTSVGKISYIYTFSIVMAMR
jgi:hypothetical protein